MHFSYGIRENSLWSLKIQENTQKTNFDSLQNLEHSDANDSLCVRTK